LVDDCGRLHAVESRAPIVDPDFQLRNPDLLFNLKVDKSWDGRQPLTKPLGRRAQRVQVVAENLQRDLRTHAREHVVQSVGDGLTDVRRNWQD
jgi:hypothetical protein